jgi:hypothetical protein
LHRPLNADRRRRSNSYSTVAMVGCKYLRMLTLLLLSPCLCNDHGIECIADTMSGGIPVRSLWWEAEECKAKPFLSSAVALFLLLLLLLYCYYYCYCHCCIMFFHLQVLYRASHQSHCKSRISTGKNLCF